MLPGVGLLYLLDLSTFADLQLVDIFVKLRDLVHQPFIPTTILPHLQRILLQKPIFLKLDLLQSLHFLRNLLLEFLLQGDNNPTAFVEQIRQLVILRQ